MSLTSLILSAILNITLPQSERVVTNLSVTEESPRIVGGFQCIPQAYPFLVTVYTEGTSVWCGGSLLNKYKVLTSAHCCSKNDLIVEAGVSYPGARSKQTSRVARMIAHPNFTTEKGKVLNDVCVAFLERPIEKSDTVSYMRLANASYFEKLLNDQKCNYSLVLGFGYEGVKYMDNTPADDVVRHIKHLQCLYVTPVTKAECEFFYANVENMICARDARNMMQGDPCHGDSGGPVICENVQIGIVTAGIGCGIGIPAIYTRVDKYLDFIYGEHRQRSNHQETTRGNFILLLFAFLIKTVLRC